MFGLRDFILSVCGRCLEAGEGATGDELGLVIIFQAEEGATELVIHGGNFCIVYYQYTIFFVGHCLCQFEGNRITLSREIRREVEVIIEDGEIGMSLVQIQDVVSLS